MTETPWSAAARDGGRNVINPSLSQQQFDAITAQQVSAWAPILRDNAPQARTVIDYGCGPGRFIPALTWMFQSVTAYDPCTAFGALVPQHGRVRFTDTVPVEQFDTVFVWAVAGGLDDDDMPGMAAEICGLMKPDGLLFFADHVEWPPRLAAWRFRTHSFYPLMFAAERVGLAPVGRCPQHVYEITMFAGRRAAR